MDEKTETVTFTINDTMDDPNIVLTHADISMSDDTVTVTSIDPVLRIQPVSEDVTAFLRRLLDPEGFGHAVTAEVRDEARRLLGMTPVEEESYNA